MIEKYFKLTFSVFLILSLFSACGQQNTNNSTTNKAVEMASQTALANMIKTEMAKIAATSYQSTKTISESLTANAPTETAVIATLSPVPSATPIVDFIEKWRVGLDMYCDGTNEFYDEYNIINNEYYSTSSSNTNYESWGEWKIIGNQLIFTYRITTISPQAIFHPGEYELLLNPDPDAMCKPNMKDYYKGRLVLYTDCEGGETSFTLNGNSISMEYLDTLYGVRYCYNGEKVIP